MTARRTHIRLAMAACGLIMGACGGQVGTHAPTATPSPSQGGYTLTVEQAAAQERTSARSAYPGEYARGTQGAPAGMCFEDAIRTSRGTCVAADNLTPQEYIDEVGYPRGY